MQIEKLQIAGLRSIKQADFVFQPGMNLIVGVNGVGKTTVLATLSLCISRILLNVTNLTKTKLIIPNHAIRSGINSAQVNCEFVLYRNKYSLLMVKQREKQIEGKDGEIIKTPDSEVITPILKINISDESINQNMPFGLYFSARRSVIVDKELPKAASVGGRSAVFSEALLARELNLRPIAQWFRAQEKLEEEAGSAIRHTEILKRTVTSFLPNFHNLRITESDTGTEFEVDKDNISLRFNQLSEGERGILAIVLDLARRLSQANPGLEDPIRDGEAIVLIDELDLHLHPKWQRSVVENLTRTFPNCQFIVTTHSPQIISAVEPEQVQLLKDGKVIRPDRTLGMDTNWILRNLMETDDRPEKPAEAIRVVEALIQDGDYDAARAQMVVYREQGYDLPEWAMYEARIARLELFDEE